MRQCVVVDIPESTLSDIHHHTPSRLPDGRLKRNKIKKPPLAVKKARLSAGTKTAACGGFHPNHKPLPGPLKGREHSFWCFLEKIEWILP